MKIDLDELEEKMHPDCYNRFDCLLPIQTLSIAEQIIPTRTFKSCTELFKNALVIVMAQKTNEEIHRELDYRLSLFFALSFLYGKRYAELEILKEIGEK